MIVLLHTLSEKETGRHEVPTDEYRVWVYLPWSVEKKEVTSDSHLLEVFRSFSEHKETKIMFEIEKISYIPVSPIASSSDIPNPQPRFMTDLNDVNFSGFEENIFYSDVDNDDVGDNDHVGVDGVPGLRELAVILEVPESACEMPNEIGNYDLFEGYQSNSEDELCSDSDDKGGDSKLATVMKRNSFKKLVGGPISQKARSKWIASKFEVLVKNNPSIQCGVISDLLRDQFNVSVDTQRSFIGVDGCHSKGPYGGVLLSAVALDANSRLYPLAYCICEGETLLSWSWFLRQLCCFLKYPEDRLICFMSDRQKGVIGALKMYWPKMRKLFRKASKTGNKHEFKKCLQDIGNINPQAIAYLAAIEPCHWLRHAFDNSIKCDHVTNNMTKAFNSMLKDFRCRTYLGLMKYKRRMVMSRFQLRKEECSRWGQGKYEMLGLNRAYTANLNDKTCECGQWQVSGVSCCHVLAGIRHHFGVNGAPIKPPHLKRKPGRPKLLRNRESTEKPKAIRSGSVVCGKCKLPRHNSRTCKIEGSPIETKKASKKQPTISEDEGTASSSKPSKKVVIKCLAFIFAMQG
ncbi:hypothetical protein EZV62_015836 [Acer yangbiense]|uniref:SWIM-type domain-containing protein n=1 Tax=Acer yangbiense TaxID=1000413 RepID=A0A5C7HLY3_9ROSI|nr:hypothetical protein EZV62_015836 [Acer yangbiense]